MAEHAQLKFVMTECSTTQIRLTRFIYINSVDLTWTFFLYPGKDYISQIRLIVGVVGSPKEDLLQLCLSPIIKNYFKGW